MRTTSTWWLLAFGSVALLASSAVWSDRAHGSQRASPHRNPVSAHSALRHAETALLVSQTPPAPAPAVARPLAAAPRPPRSRAAPPVAILVDDEPPPRAPVLWDELFPGQGVQGHGDAQTPRPCFDQLQGIQGLSPCPAQTPRP